MFVGEHLREETLRFPVLRVAHDGVRVGAFEQTVELQQAVQIIPACLPHPHARPPFSSRRRSQWSVSEQV